MTDDPRAPFYLVDLNFREALRTTLMPLSDEELQEVHDLFARTNHKDIPMEFWFLAPKVRILIRAEQSRRAKRAAFIKNEATEA